MSRDDRGNLIQSLGDGPPEERTSTGAGEKHQRWHAATVHRGPHTFVNMPPIRRSRAPDTTASMNRSTRVLGVACSLVIARLALAQAPAPPAPPQEAVDACAGRESGAACSFQHGDHAVAGSCQVLPGGITVACAPTHLHFRLGPPPEALEACKGQQDGASCQFTESRGETVAGVCRTGPHGEPPACAPKDAVFLDPGTAEGAR